MRISARAIIVNTENQMLLVKHHGSEFWSLPGGKVEKNEDLKTCLQREIFEELGILCEVQDLQYVHEFRYSPESDVSVEFFFAVRLKDETITQWNGENTTDELHDIQWISADDLTNIRPEFLKTYFSSRPSSFYISYL